MPDNEWIRVRFRDSGTEQSIPKPAAIDEDAYEVLDADAVDHNGRELPPEFPAKTKTGQTAATKKENG